MTRTIRPADLVLALSLLLLAFVVLARQGTAQTTSRVFGPL